jgi:hypothetical protein
MLWLDFVPMKLNSMPVTSDISRWMGGGTQACVLVESSINSPGLYDSLMNANYEMQDKSRI